MMMLTSTSAEEKRTAVWQYIVDYADKFRFLASLAVRQVAKPTIVFASCRSNAKITAPFAAFVAEHHQWPGVD